jgi:Nif-specific regulatory protein
MTRQNRRFPRARTEGQTHTPAASPALLGDSPAIQAVRDGIERVKRRILRSGPEFVVLIQGESGSGKEVVARMIHEATRAPAPFVASNVASVDAGVFESTIFGHERGAFTTAVEQHKGILEQAGDGSVFLDEIGDLRAESQATLLRVVETRELYRVGGRELLRFNGLMMAATHVDLGRAVNEGRFRHDLLQRLNGHRLYLPPLRSRPEDIPVLANAFAKHNTISACALRLLANHDWPGNVRELKRVIELADSECETGTLRADLLERILHEQREGMTPIGSSIPPAMSASTSGQPTTLSSAPPRRPQRTTKTGKSTSSHCFKHSNPGAATRKATRS